MESPLRIAVLECDITIGKLSEGYGVIFQRLFESAAKLLADTETGKPPSLRFTKYNVVEDPENYPDLSAVDAVVLSGSKFNAFDNEPWIVKLVDFTRSVLAQDRVRLVGICFGHQIIGRALNAPVARSDRGWELAVTKVELTEVGKRLFRLEKMAIHQMHRDVVHEYPTNVEPIGQTARCVVQGMYIKNRLITVQGHPEFNGEVVAELMERRHDSGIIDTDTFNEAMQRVRSPHDGIAIAAGFLRFLLEN